MLVQSPMPRDSRLTIHFLLLAVALAAFSACAHGQRNPSQPCPNIHVNDGELRLNENERVLVCGSGEGGDGWRSIPIPQSTLHLKTILQNQGYLTPRFERTGDSLEIWRGPQSEIKSIKIIGADEVLHADKKRKVIGYPLEPGKLNEVEAWAYAAIRRDGFACAQLTLEAHEWNGELQVKADLSTRKKFGMLEPGGLDGLDPAIINRYRPFEGGQQYDIRKTQLLTSRLLGDGLFQSAYVVVRCHGDIVDLKLETSVGKPKIFRFGIGASTEKFPFIDLSFRNARLDNEASSFTTRLQLSKPEQILDFTSELYWIPGSSRSFFGPRFKIARTDESTVETNTASTGADIGRHFDWLDTRFIVRGGPTLNYVKTVRGAGPDNVLYPTVEGLVTLTSHDYEASIREQYEGWTAQFAYRGQNKGLGSKVDVNRYKIDFKSLWNIGVYSPPLFVIGTRIEGVVVDADAVNESQNRDLVPVDDRIYMGGDDNLRGFKRQSINNDGLGFLTSIYIGFELRLIEELPYHVQPFLLWDGARLGNRRYSVDEPIYTSEGLGLRWASPFGTLRGSAARGRVFRGDASTSGFPDQWVYFLSFGQEF
ncbi:hypothetical protein BH10BDE1_BH10BDE1_15770 [soil metagenome]